MDGIEHGKACVAALSQKLRKMTAACARVVVPAGLRVVGLVPLMSPTDRAHRMDSRA